MNILVCAFGGIGLLIIVEVMNGMLSLFWLKGLQKYLSHSWYWKEAYKEVGQFCWVFKEVGFLKFQWFSLLSTYQISSVSTFTVIFAFCLLWVYLVLVLGSSGSTLENLRDGVLMNMWVGPICGWSAGGIHQHVCYEIQWNAQAALRGIKIWLPTHSTLKGQRCSSVVDACLARLWGS
jgi:hypothetical protein